MRRYYRIDISECAMQDEGPQIFNTLSQQQPTMAGVVGWIRDRYANIPNMVQDANEGYAQDILVFRFPNADWSHSPVETWHQIDYVHITSVTETDIDVDMFALHIEGATA